jgi:peptidase M48-like protein
MLDDLRRKMGGVKLHSVSVNDEFNASILQVPRWGVFGNYRNHLEVGMPLIAALSMDELKAVLAHEMGHISGSHGKFGAWIYRQRMTWRALASKLQEPSNFFEQILCAFYVWYAPYFHAYTFVLARSQEYEADRAAAAATSSQAVGASLVKTELIARFLQEVFWKRLFDQVTRVPAPPYMPFSAMPRAIRIAEKEWARRDWMQQGMRDVSNDDDTHPSMAERLGALGVEPVMPEYRPEQTALQLLEPVAPLLVKRFDDHWRAGVLSEWKSRHAAAQQAQPEPEPARRAS